MGETGENNPQAQLQAELDLWSLLKQTENKQYCKRLRDDIRKARASMIQRRLDGQQPSQAFEAAYRVSSSILRLR
jgi:hypothetical protein